MSDFDPWRLNEWLALPDRCFISGCASTEICERGPVFLRDGSIHKACTPHWDGVMSVLGQQSGPARG